MSFTVRRLTHVYVGPKWAGAAVVQTTTKLSKVDKVLEGGTVATHVNNRIKKEKPISILSLKIRMTLHLSALLKTSTIRIM